MVRRFVLAPCLRVWAQFRQRVPLPSLVRESYFNVSSVLLRDLGN